MVSEMTEKITEQPLAGSYAQQMLASIVIHVLF